MRSLPQDRKTPARSRLDREHPAYSEILAVHQRAVAAEMPGYPDPETGLFVFTASYLWDRGYCCETGCRHCPYVER